MNHLSNRELLEQIQNLVREETKLTNLIILYVQEIEKRRLYLEVGCATTFEFLTQKLGYCESSAYRRMQVSRLALDVPSVIDKLEDGSLSLTLASKVQSFFNAEQKRTKESLDIHQKTEIIESIEGLSLQKATQKLMKTFPESSQEMNERVKPISPDKNQVTVILTQEQLNDLQRLKEIYSHQLPNPSWGDLISYMSKKLLKKDDPMTQGLSSKQSKKKTIFQKHDGCCSFKDPLTGEKCSSKHQLQVDHIIPKAMGGTDDLDNLRILCRKHNFHEAEKHFGKSHMSQFLSH